MTNQIAKYTNSDIRTLINRPYDRKRKPIFAFIDKDCTLVIGVSYLTNQNSQKTIKNSSDFSVWFALSFEDGKTLFTRSFLSANDEMSLNIVGSDFQ